MKRLPTIERYLSAHTAKLGAAPGGRRPRVLPFITISRQAGAGGHRLAETLLDVFDREDDVALFGGWQVFDRKICEFVANDPAFSERMSSLLNEEYQASADVLFHRLLGSTHDHDVLMQRVFRVAEAVASIGKCIIIGRAGSEVTRDMGQGISVRLVAPESDRILGTMKHYGLQERAAREKARKLDRDRGKLLKRYFDVDIDDPVRYDVVWNTGRASFEEIAASLVTVVRNRVAVPKVVSES